MTGIDPREAASALADINSIVHRVRQSTIYRLGSLMLILWGALIFAGNIATELWPRQGGYIWIAVNVLGCAGSFAVGAVESRRIAPAPLRPQGGCRLRAVLRFRHPVRRSRSGILRRASSARSGRPIS